MSNTNRTSFDLEISKEDFDTVCVTDYNHFYKFVDNTPIEIFFSRKDLQKMLDLLDEQESTDND